MSEMALQLIRQAKAEGWKTLDLGNTGIVGEVPAEIWELTELEELILSDEWFEEQKGLIRSKNKGKPNEITSFPEYAGHNAMTNVPSEDSPDGKTLRGLTLLTRLVLKGRQIVDINSLSYLTNLESLDLDNTSVTDINPLASLCKLQSLFLDFTNVADIRILANLDQLQDLGLAGTQIVDIQALASIRNLRLIYLNRTKVADTQPLANLKNLKELHLNETLITDIQPLRSQIEKGLMLSLENCPITNPPYEIALQGNEAILNYWEQKEKEASTYINRELKLILLGNSDAGKTSMRLFLESNGDLSKGHDSTHGMETVIWKPKFELKRLKDLPNPDKEEFKVRILDFGGQEYYHDTHHLFFTTNTAYMVLWSKAGNVFGGVKAFQKKKDKEEPEVVMLLNAPLPYWLDAIMHFCEPTEADQLFESPQAENEGAENDLVQFKEPVRIEFINDLESPDEQQQLIKEHLRNTSSERTPKDSRSIEVARTLVIQNKLDIDGRHFIPEDQLKQRFPIIYDFASVSLEPPHGMRLSAFMDLLQEMMEQMPIVGQEWPMSTKYIKAALDTFDEAHYDKTRDEFLEWSRDKVKAATGTEAQLDMDWLQYLIPYLAQIGLLLHFPDTTHAVLKNKVFLRPDKVTGRIYEILDRLHASEGRFDRPHAWQALGRTPTQVEALKKDPQSDKETETLLALMRHFRIIFLEGNDPNRFVAPLYLPGEPIRGVQLFLGLFKQPTFRVQYPGFIHKSVVLHFFEEFGPRAFSEQSASGQTLHYYWRNGIVVKDPKSPAMVLLQFAFGEEIKDKPGEYTPAHVDVFQLGGKGDIHFTREVLATIATINKGWKAKEMVTANGVDFVEVKALKAAEQAKLYTYLDKEQGKIFQLRDFKDLLEFKMPMKKVFISYSKADAAHLQALENHLSVFKRKGDIDTWNCRKLIPGEKWDGKIKQELEEADIIIFLVSADFLATDYIWDVEIKRAVERDEAGKAKVVPIIVRSCVWQDSPLGKFQSPEKAAPISSASNVDEAWTKVAENLRKIF